MTHIKNDDFTELIECAQKSQWFGSSNPAFKKHSLDYENTGYGHEALVKLLVDPILKGDVKNVYLIGGCDNADPER